MKARLSSCAALAVWCLSCAANPLGARLVAVHNAMLAVGSSSLGGVVDGNLREGESQRFPTELSSGCHLFVAEGAEGLRSLELTVLGATGQRVAGVTSRGPQGSVQYCAPAAGRFTVALRAAQGAGAFLLGEWRSGGAVASGSTELEPPPADAPSGLRPVGTVHAGANVEGELTAQDHRLEDRSVGDDYALPLGRGEAVTIVLRGGRSASGRGQSMDMYLVLFDSEGEELEHDDDSAGSLNSRIVFRAPTAGTYYLRVTTFGSGLHAGTYTLMVRAGEHANAR